MFYSTLIDAAVGSCERVTYLFFRVTIDCTQGGREAGGSIGIAYLSYRPTPAFQYIPTCIHTYMPTLPTLIRVHVCVRQTDR